MRDSEEDLHMGGKGQLDRAADGPGRRSSFDADPEPPAPACAVFRNLSRREFIGNRKVWSGVAWSSGCAVFAWLAAGCGTNLGRPLVYVECGGDEATRRIADAVVVFDWDGGTSALYPDDPFDGLDLADFATVDGGTLADRADDFKEFVRTKVSQIYCDMPDFSVKVEQRDDAGFSGAKTTVFFGQFRAPGGGGQVGEADYDPCNRHADDEAIIFGAQYERLGGPYSFDEWVTMFANTAAHEIGHTLGYGHIDRADRPDPARSLFVELMLDRHTVSELQQEQRIVVEQSTCPSLAATAKTAIAGEDLDLVYICNHLDTHGE